VLIATRARALRLAFVDERRIVASDGGGCARTRNAHPVSSGNAAPRHYTVQSVGGTNASKFPPFDPAREAGARTES